LNIIIVNSAPITVRTMHLILLFQRFTVAWFVARSGVSWWTCAKVNSTIRYIWRSYRK